MLSIVFLAAALVVLVGGVGGTFAAQAGVMPESIAQHWAMISSAGSFAGSGLALLGLALLFKKSKKLDRLVGGSSTSSRIRRNRLASKAQDQDDDEESAPPSTKTSAMRRTTPQPKPQTPTPSAQAQAQASTETGTRQMRRATGRISNRRKPAQ